MTTNNHDDVQHIVSLSQVKTTALNSQKKEPMNYLIEQEKNPFVFARFF